MYTEFPNKLFHYRRMFSEALARGWVYWPGEHVVRFGLQSAVIEPIPAPDIEDRFQWGEVVKVVDGHAKHIEEGDDNDDFYGVVSRNATGTMGVLDEQVMGMAPRQTLSIFRGARNGAISVPVQNVQNTIGDGSIDEPEKGDKVYIRVKSHGSEAPSWSSDTEYVEGQVVTEDDTVYTCIKDHTSGSDSKPDDGSDWEDYWREGAIDLPLGGVESVDNAETEEWEKATFTHEPASPYRDEDEKHYAKEDTPTTMVAAIDLE